MEEQRITQEYQYDPKPFCNPLMGYAPRIWDKGDTLASLRYLELTWRELEPDKGHLRWNKLAEQYGFSALKAQGVHFVLRFLCDRPGPEKHLDIPDWLYRATLDGKFYRTAYGCGYAPDYTNTMFQIEHTRLLRTLGEAVKREGMVAFVELGSLGHWGEWHTQLNAGLPPFPDEALREQYAAVYLDAFPQAKLLMRRPFSIAQAYHLGLYNDMAGEPKATEEWLKWIKEGGWYGMEPNALRPMPDFWREAPAGGELTSALSMKELLDTQREQTLRLLQQSHMTFLGPLAPDPDYAEGYRAVLKCLGYRLWVRMAILESLPEEWCLLTLWFRNEGAAPFYWDSSVHVLVETPDGFVQAKTPVPLRLSILQPDMEQRIQVQIENCTVQDIQRHQKCVTLGICDPMTGQYTVRFAMQAPQRDGKVVLFGYQTAR